MYKLLQLNFITVARVAQRQYGPQSVPICGGGARSLTMKKGLPPAPSAPRRGSATPVPALAPDVDSEEEDAVYVWVDGFNFSRPKKNIIRDFSDGGNSTTSRVE